MLNFYKKKKKFELRDLLFYGNLLVFVGCIVYLGNYYLVGAQSEAKVAQLSEKMLDNGIDPTIVDKDQQVDEDGNLVVMDKYKVLLEEYPDIVGWIKVESVDGAKESPIDYPIMQTFDDPDYYIDKDVNGDYSREGTPFMDYRCDIKKPTDNFIIYAHNMANKHQFGSLKQFRSEDYYKKHPTIKFETLYSAGTYEIVAAFYAQIYNKEDDVFKYYNFIDADNEEEFDEFIKTIKKRALYDTGVDAKYGDQLITLSTCNYDISSVEKSRGRFVVVARLKKSDSTNESILGDEDMDDDKYVTDGTTPTPVPEETKKPEKTKAPESEKPEGTKKPEETKTPEDSEVPPDSTEPEDTQAPSEPDASETKKPEGTKPPKGTKEPTSGDGEQGENTKPPKESKEPVDTKDPETPDEPEVPDEPETPDEPDVPSEPETPDEPVVPDNPEVPDEPVTPDDPETPTEPETPIEPETPEEPINPEQPDTPNTEGQSGEEGDNE